MLLSIASYFVFSLVVGRPKTAEFNATVSLVLLAGALSAVLISFPVKSKLLNRAIELQRVQLVQQAYIVAWAISEVAALLGLLDFFTTGDRYYYVLLLIAAVGQLLHAPRREHVISASGKTPIF